MFIIFGIKPITTKQEILETEHSCPNCNSVMRPAFLRRITFISFFFIPVIPVHIANYLVCTNCSNPVKIPFSAARNLSRG